MTLHYLKYVERSHIREKCRLLGIYIYSLIKSNIYDDYIGFYIINTLLILSDMFSGFYEGSLNLEGMIQLYKNTKHEEEKNNNLNTNVKMIEYSNKNIINESDSNSSLFIAKYKEQINNTTTLIKVKPKFPTPKVTKIQINKNIQK